MFRQTHIIVMYWMQKWDVSRINESQTFGYNMNENNDHKAKGSMICCFVWPKSSTSLSLHSNRTVSQVWGAELGFVGFDLAEFENRTALHFKMVQNISATYCNILHPAHTSWNVFWNVFKRLHKLCYRLWPRLQCRRVSFDLKAQGRPSGWQNLTNESSSNLAVFARRSLECLCTSTLFHEEDI